MSELLFSFKDVTIRLPGEELYPGINFELKAGEHWAFIGENEGLKTALMEAIAGNASVIGRTEFPFFEKDKAQLQSDPLLSPQRFIVKIAGRHHFRNLSNTTQFYYQQRFNSTDSEDALTVQEYLESIPATRELPIDVEAVVKRMKLESLLDKQVIKLSHGETKRLLIAAALLRHPRILLFVNPFTGLNADTRKELREIINDVANAGISVILSTGIHEIPDVVTHIADFRKDNAIVCTEKEAAAPAINRPLHQNRIHKDDVQELLANGNRPSFENIVSMKDVCIQYGDKRILNNVNWTIKQGERWALLGPNGAGKSTLLSLISGDNPQAFANHIFLFDKKKGSGESIWDIKRKIGFFSPELYQYFPLETSCLDAVESGFYDTIGLFCQRNAARRALALRWMGLLGVDDLPRKLLSQASPVQQRLCLLARAFVKAPPLLILDEPCQGFNDEQVAMFKDLVNAICSQSHTTLIYVTHYKEEIPDCVTKVFRLENGQPVH